MSSLLEEPELNPALIDPYRARGSAVSMRLVRDVDYTVVSPAFYPPTTITDIAEARRCE